MAITEIIELSANTKGVEQGIKQASKLLADFSKKAYQALIGADTSEAEEKISAVTKMTEDIKDSNINVTATTQSAVRSLNDIDKRVRGLDDAEINVEADTTQAVNAVNSIQRSVANLEDTNIRVDADTSGARSAVNNFQNDVNQLQGANIPITVDESDAVSSVRRVDNVIDRLPDRKDIEINADASGFVESADKAANVVNKIQSDINSIQGTNIPINVDESDVISSVQRADRAINSLPDNYNIDINGDATDLIKGAKQASTVVKNLQSEINSVEGKDVPINVDESDVISSVLRSENAINSLPQNYNINIDADATDLIKGAKQASTVVKNLQSEINSVEGKDVPITVDESDVISSVLRSENAINSLPQNYNINIDADATNLIKGAKQASTVVKNLQSEINSIQGTNIPISVDESDAISSVQRADRAINSLPDNYNINIDADADGFVEGATKAANAVDRIKADVNSIKGAKIPIEVDERSAVSAINKVEGEIDDLPDSFTIDLDADDSKATSVFTNISNRLKQLVRGNEIVVTADTSKADDAVKPYIDSAGRMRDPATGRYIKQEVQISTGKAGASIGSLTDSIQSKFVPSLGAAGALGAVGLLAGGLAALADRGTELEKNFIRIQAQTGLTAEGMEQLRESAENSFNRGLGSTLTEAANNIAFAQQQLGSFLDTKGIEDFTVKAAGIAKVFDKDINEVISSSRTFIANFGLEGEEAANLIAVAMQGAGNRMDDVNDTLDEYSQLMKGAGLSAEQFVGVLTTGVQQGVRDTDKLADAIKEAQIRINAGDFSAPIRDLSKTVTGEAASIVSNIEGILQQAQAGNISIIDAVGLSSKAIQEGVDSGAISRQLQDQLNVAISGTQAEDIGAELYTRVFSASIDEEAIRTRAGEAGALMEQAIAPQGFEGLKRQLSLALDDLSTSVLPTLQPIFTLISDSLLPVITNVFNAITPLVQSLTATLGPLLAQIFETITPVLEQVFEALMPVVDAFNDLLQSVVPPLIEAIAPLLDVLVPIAEVLGRLAGAIGNNLKSFVLAIIPAVEKLVPVIVDLVDLFAELMNEYLEAMAPLTEQLAGLLGTVLATAVTIVIDVFKIFFNILGSIFKAIFGGETAMDGFKNAIQALGTVAQTVTSTLTGIVDTVSNLVNGIGNFVTGIGKALKLIPDEKKGDFTVPFGDGYYEQFEKAGFSAGFFTDQFIKLDDTATNVANNDQITPTTNSITSLGGAAKEAAPTLEQLYKNLATLAISGKQNTDQYKALYQEVVNQTRATNEYNDAVSRIKDQIKINLQFEAQAPLEAIDTASLNIFQGLDRQIEFDPIVPTIDAKESLDEYADYYADIQETTRNLALKFQQDVTENGIGEKRKQLDQELKDTQESLRNGEISYEEASKRELEIARQQADLEKEIQKDKWADIGALAGEALAGQFDILAQQSRTALDQIYSDAAAFGAQFGQYGEGAADDLINSFEYLEANSTEILGNMGQQFGATFAGMVANGENAISALGKSALLTVIDNAEKMILANLPVIFSFLSGILPPPFGQIVAGGLIATAMAMLSTAKAKIGAEEGGLITKAYSKPAGVTDTIPLWVAPGEFIMPTNVTKRNQSLLEYLRGGGSEEQYFVNKYKGKMQSNQIVAGGYDNKALGEFRSMNARLARLEKYQSDMSKKLDSATLVKGYYTHKTEVKQTIKQELKSESYRF